MWYYPFKVNENGFEDRCEAVLGWKERQTMKNPFWKLWHILQPISRQWRKKALKRIMKVSPNSFLLFFALAAPSEISNSIRAAIGDDCISQHFTHNDLGIRCNGHLNSLQYEYFNFDCCHSLICSNIWFHFKLSGKKQKAMKCFQESYWGTNLTSAVFRACIYKKLFTFSLFWLQQCLLRCGDVNGEQPSFHKRC